ncbi:unnamed protein product [Brachionus calyciflorus]|uniref:BHLH domain-containing protein n=1 Tax=Brachionus calyciflorus TaxID=104777 RepID=A0A813USF0_9BILA|nr:unnamed protein product [Brachionus calyciflorus]
MSPKPIGTLTMDLLSCSNEFNAGFNFPDVDPLMIMNDSYLISNLSTSPECSRSSCSSISSLTCSLLNKNKNNDIINTNSDCILDSLGQSLSFSLDKISNNSFMEYFNLSDSVSVSPPNQSECLIDTQLIKNNLILRKKKFSISSTSCLFPANFDDLDDNLDNLNNEFNPCDLNDVINGALLNNDETTTTTTSNKINFNFDDFNFNDEDEEDDHNDQLNQHDNSEALIAIREMAIRDRRSQQRKHKNSTSSISSQSMSSRIKKFAIDLQNTACNFNIKPMPIYSSTTTTTTTTTTNNNTKIDSLLDNEINLDKDCDFSDFLELEGWQEMLDEDCISRLTTDFNSNLINEDNKKPLDTTNVKLTTIKNTQINNLKTTLKLPTTTVLSSSTTVPKVQNLSNLPSTHKSQPLVVVLSNETTKTNPNPMKQIFINKPTTIKKTTNLNQTLTITNNQIKKLNIQEPTTDCTTTISNSNKETSEVKELIKEDVSSVNEQVPTSLIDQTLEVIDCINPDQIFPLRLASSRKIENKDENKKYEILEKNLKKIENNVDDDDEEEEIDVVSVNSSNCLTDSNNNNEAIVSTSSKGKLGQVINNSSANLSHHNYFHQPTSNKKQSQTSPNSNNKTNNSKDQLSLLAKCLKSPNSTTSSTSPTSLAFSSPKSESKSLIDNPNKNQSNIINNDKKRLSANNLNKISKINDSLTIKTCESNNEIIHLNKQKSLIANVSPQLTPTLPKSFSSSTLVQNTTKTNMFNTTTLTSNKNITQSTSNLKETTTNAQKIPNSIRILTTTSNNSNKAIRQINQTTTLASNVPSNKNVTSNILQISNNTSNSNNNTLCKITKNLQQTSFNRNPNDSGKIITTTLIAKPQINLINQVANNKSTSLSIGKQNDENYETLSDFKQKLLFSNSKSSSDLTKNKISKLNKNNKISKSNYDDEDLDDFDDDLDDLDDDDDDDEDEISSGSSDSDDFSSGLSFFPTGSNSTLSPLSMTSSSGCSTPTKSKNRNKVTNDNNNINDKLNEKLKTKKIRKNKQNMLGQCSSMKRNNRLNSMGYSSENPAEKRAFHILSERQRRNDLKKLFETLRTNIPNLCDKQKASKLTILKAAVDHLIEVSNKKEKLNLIFDKEKQKNALLIQNLKNLQQSFNNNNNFNVVGHQNPLSVH